MANNNEQTVPLNLISVNAKPKTKFKCETVCNYFCFIVILKILLCILLLYRNHKANKPGKTTKFNFCITCFLQDQDQYQHTLADFHRSQLQQTLDFHRLRAESTVKWKQHAITIAGGNGQGNGLNQLYNPQGIHIDGKGQSIYIADSFNHRIVQWKFGENSGQIIAGGNGEGNRIDQLSFPADVIIDQNNNSLIICDWGNRRVVRWSLTTQQFIQIIVEDTRCGGLQMSESGDLFIADIERHVVKKWKKDENKGIIVAGGNGDGDLFNQLNHPTFIFVDQNDTVYVSDSGNHRVMKWFKDAKHGIIVAGGYDNGHRSNQLFYPQGLFVSKIGNVYVAAYRNHQIMRWPSESRNGYVIVGGNCRGNESNQLRGPIGLSLDAHNNLYIADSENNRIQRFEFDRK